MDFCVDLIAFKVQTFITSPTVSSCIPPKTLPSQKKSRYSMKFFLANTTKLPTGFQHQPEGRVLYHLLPSTLCTTARIKYGVDVETSNLYSA